MVSISCLTYNHAAYIRECLDGFLNQKCNFAFEVLIHDDASNDGTQEIIKEYQEKYPEIIKPYIQVENQFSKGRRGFNAKYNFSRAKGKYIAMCEGDDYWTDPLKLQKQVDFLEENKEFNFVGHLTREISDIKDRTFKFISPVSGKLNFKQVIQYGYPCHTTSFFFRRKSIKEILPYLLKTTSGDRLKTTSGDRPLLYHLSFSAPIYILNEYMSVYRHNEESVTKKGLNKIKPNLFKYSVINLYLPFIEKNSDYKFFLKKNASIIYLKRLYNYTKTKRLTLAYFSQSTIELFKFLIK